MDNDCESVWNVSFYCISGEKIQMQVYCISDTDTRYRSHNDARYKIHFSYLRYVYTSILITIQHWADARYHFCNALCSMSAKNNIVSDFGPVVSTVLL